MKLTGRTRYRIGFLKKMILQVEVYGNYEDPIDFSDTGPEYKFWRDATYNDLYSLNII